MTNWLIDVDGTVCEDIPNEEAWRFADAKPLEGSVEWVNSLTAKGDTVTFFTSRQSQHRLVTLEWLCRNGFHFIGLITDKPRGGQYHWVDNLSVKATHWTGGPYPT